MPEFDPFDDIVTRHGPPRDAQTVKQSYAETYRGHLPEGLLRFWVRSGWGSWYDGRFWLCDPALLKPVVDEIFAGDPEFQPENLLAIGYEAFGNVIYLWHPQHKMVFLRMMFGEVSTLSTESLVDQETGQIDNDDDIVGGILVFPLEAEHNESWVDEDGNKMFPTALKRLGRLAPGEIYGFVPALQLGGANDVKNVHKFPIVEHLLLLASLTDFRLTRHIDVPGTFGRIEDVRPIGASTADD